MRPILTATFPHTSWRSLPLLLLLLLAASCQRNPTASQHRVAIMPAVVLTADPALDWTAAGVPLVLTQDLATARNVSAVLANNESNAYAANAQEILRTTVEARNGRILVKATLTTLATQRNQLAHRERRPGERGLAPDLERSGASHR